MTKIITFFPINPLTFTLKITLLLEEENPNKVQGGFLQKVLICPNKRKNIYDLQSHSLFSECTMELLYFVVHHFFICRLHILDVSGKTL